MSRTINLTLAEQEAMNATVALANALGRVVGHGPTRDHDLGELFGYVHAIQHAIMAQPLARAHPDRFRLLGEVIAVPDSGPWGEAAEFGGTVPLSTKDGA